MNKLVDAMARKQTHNKFLQLQQWHEDEAGLGAADLIEVTSTNDSNTVASDCDYLDRLMSDNDNQFGGQSSSSNALSLVSNNNSVNNDSGNSHMVDSAEELFDCPDDLFEDCLDTDLFELLDWDPSNTQLQPPPDSLFDQSMQIQMLPPLDALDYCYPHMMPMYDDVGNFTLNGVDETSSIIQPPTITPSYTGVFNRCFGVW